MTPDELARLEAVEARLERFEKMLGLFFKALTTIRAAVIMILGGLEDALGYRRTIKPRSEQGF